MTVLVSDSFNRADSVTLGTTDSYNGGTATAWTSITAVYGVSSNQAYPSTGVNDGFATVETNNTDVKITVNNTCSSNVGEPGIYFRATDTNNNFRVVRSAGSIYLQKKISGTRTTITSKVISWTLNEKYSVITKSDGTIQVYVNDVLQITATDTNLTTVTKHGIGNGATNTPLRWDNFQVEDLATGGTGTTYSGAGTSAGISSLTQPEKVIQLASGSTQGNSSLTSAEKTILSGSGISQGSSSLTTNETKIYSANGSAQGTSTGSSNEHVIYSASGTSQGSSSLSSGETVISQTGTTYSASGTAQGSSSLTSSDKVVFGANGTSHGTTILSPGEHLILPSIGTSTGQSSLTSNETVVGHGTTTYSASGQAQGSSSLSSAETMSYIATGTAQGLSSLIAHEIISLLASGISEGYSTLTFIDKSNQIIGTIHLKGSQVLNVTLQGEQSLNVNLKGGI